MKRFIGLVCICLAACYALEEKKYEVQNYNHLLGMPGFSDDLLGLHLKLYAGYVSNLNDLFSRLEGMSKDHKEKTYEFGALKRRVAWEFDGMRLHELYFGHLGGMGNVAKAPRLTAALVEQFGSVERWRQEFSAMGLMRGIGWVILYFDAHSNRLVNAWVEEHENGHLATARPIVILDVFEHAYLTQYGLDRAKYIEAFFSNLNWEVIEKRFLAPY